MNVPVRDRMSVRDYLSDVFTHAVQVAFPELGDKTASVASTNEKYVHKFGDFQCNDAMALCKIFKDKGEDTIFTRSKGSIMFQRKNTGLHYG